jgi:hypothetical protein
MEDQISQKTSCGGVTISAVDGCGWLKTTSLHNPDRSHTLLPFCWHRCHILNRQYYDEKYRYSTHIVDIGKSEADPDIDAEAEAETKAEAEAEAEAKA